MCDMKIALRKLEEKDMEGMLEWMHDPDIQKNFHFLAEMKTYNDVLEFIHTAQTYPVDGKSIHYAVVNDEDEYLGTISLKNVDMTAKNAGYAICLRKKAQGQGIGVKATRKILELAFGQFGLERVYLNVLSENERAIQLYVRCGFIYEGEFRNHLFLRGEYKSLKWYSMLKKEFADFSGGI